MAGIADYSTTAASNTTVGGVNIQGTAPASNIDNGLRAIMADIATALAAGTFSATGYVAKSSTYSVLTTDRGKLIDCTSALELDLPAAATAGAGFLFWVKANGAAVTLDPNGSENINGASTTITVQNGSTVMVVCTGSEWHTGFNGLATLISPAFTGSGSVTLTAAGGAVWSFKCVDNGATGADITYVLDSATPAASDVIVRHLSQARDSAGNLDVFALYATQVLDPVSTSEDSAHIWQTMLAGTLATRMSLAGGIYMAGTTDQGAGTINATAVYDDGVQLITAAGVPTAIAALSVGGVGTYGFFHVVTENLGTAPGATLAGSGLEYSNAAGSVAPTSPSGTWRFMGYSPSGTLADNANTGLWLRTV